MTERYPGYDVLSKRNGPSWNDATRKAVDARLALHGAHFFSAAEWETLVAVCDTVMPQTGMRERIDLPALVDHKMAIGHTDGYRYPGMPVQGEAWRRGLAALDEAARRAGKRFHELGPTAQEAMMRDMQHGTFEAEALQGMPAKTFFTSRVVADVVSAYYAHPTAWSEIGWAGPASPRGYVRLQSGMRDPWEPEEAKPGQEARAVRVNSNVR